MTITFPFRIVDWRVERRAVWTIIVIILGCPLFGVGYIYLPLPADAPVVRLRSQVHSFAGVLANSKSHFTFTAQNNLWDILFIDRLDRSCGCTSARTNCSVVLPGQKFSIEAVLSAPGFAEDMSSHITLQGHAGRRRVEADYQLLGTVENVIEFPDAGGGSLHLGSWRLDQLPAVASITVSRGKYPLCFDELRAECASPNISAHVEPISDGFWRVLLRVNSADALGTAGYPLTFKFARHGNLLPVTVGQQAYFELLGPVLASPPSLLLTLSPGEHIRKTITIAERQEYPYQIAPEIAGISFSATNLTASWQNSTKQSAVIIDYTAPTRAGADRGDIIISVKGQGSTYKIKVGYLAMVS